MSRGQYKIQIAEGNKEAQDVRLDTVLQIYC